ncbi:MAG: VTT domain-containing protein [Gemmatimonadaceae bacterium]|nr:VTT domain-containing protein [Gemmatimonadaceae bacterium]
MHSLGDLWHQYSDPTALIQWGGYVGLALIIFAETGLLIGFFLPGDSLLVSAGLIASRGTLDVWFMCAILTVAAVLGQTVGYAIGHAAGPKLFARENSMFFKRSHLQRAHDFYEKHGGATIVLARFMPIVRTFVPVVAGAARMSYRPFQLYNVIGGIAWVCGMLMIGYGLGRYIPGIDKNIDKVIIVVILVSLAPALIGAWRRKHAAVAEVATPDLRSTITED